MRSYLMILAGLTLSACGLPGARQEADLRAGFAPVTTEAAFLDRVAGTRWQSDEIRVAFLPGGTLDGAVNGVPVTGAWRWSGALFCTEFHVGDSGGDGCSELGIRPGELLVVPLSGRGAPYTYTRIGG